MPTSTGEPPNPKIERVRRWTLRLDVEHLYGPLEDFRLEKQDLAVVCVVRNGRPYVKAFVEHYVELGARRIVVLDNGSTDGTVEAFRGYEQVTVLRSTLPFKRYQMTMKQYLMERFGGGGWSLCVDIDELFDYPFSNVVPLEDLLGYLNERRYTAVVAQMLDMFPEEAISEGVGGEDESFKELHRFYDLSNIRSFEYRSAPIVSGTGNVVSNEDIEVYRGGVQTRVFGTGPQLTKQPLVFLDGEIKPMDAWAHTVSNARIADFSCVLYHYKFLGHLYGHIRRAVSQGNYPNLWGKYEKMANVLENSPELRIKDENARELKGVNDLVANGFLVVSREYLKLVGGTKNTDGPDDGLDALSGVLLGAVGEAKSQAKAVREERRRAKRSHPGHRELRIDLEKERRRNRNLEERARNLAAQVQAIKSSRVWKLLNRLDGLRARVLNRG